VDTPRRADDKKLLIELLQHQPCTVAPTAIRCKEEHAEGACYTLLKGTWAHPQEISPAQRQILIDVARRSTEVPEHVATEGAQHTTTSTRPGDLLNDRADSTWWQELLLDHGWRDVSRPGWARRGVYYFQRPGKQGHEPSATYGKTGTTLYVFSSNAQPFEPETAYTPFAAYTLLKHAGDYKAVAAALATLYGLEPKPAPIHELSQHRNGHTPGPEPIDPYACPELPDTARIDAQAAAEASRFLHDYVAFSTKWAPRAYHGFHETVALFVLATLAARRVKIAFGAGQYTSLYLALAGRTGLFTKTTAADIGIALLRRVAPYLLAADDSTPQALIRAMVGVAHPGYDEMDEVDQLTEQRRLAFAAQRGWFYEEWGQHLDAMMDSHGGNMTLFRSILRRMDDQKGEYLAETITRGGELLTKPYLTLLCNVTPMDLQPFAKKDSKLWRDGFLARFAFSTPEDDDSTDAEYPREDFQIPPRLVTELYTWHESLGIPTCRLEPVMDKKDTPTGTYHVVRAPLRETTYTLSGDVWQQYYAYDVALRQIMRTQQAAHLDGSYIRFPAKALRIAALLASLHGGATREITPQFWARGQQITEQWRLELHRLVRQLHTAPDEPGERRALEDALVQQARQRGPQTLREFGIFHKAHSRDEIARAVKTLTDIGELVPAETGKSVRFGAATDVFNDV
jgi:hypothetical protein